MHGQAPVVPLSHTLLLAPLIRISPLHVSQRQTAIFPLHTHRTTLHNRTTPQHSAPKWRFASFLPVPLTPLRRLEIMFAPYPARLLHSTCRRIRLSGPGHLFRYAALRRDHSFTSFPAPPLPHPTSHTAQLCTTPIIIHNRTLIIRM